MTARVPPNGVPRRPARLVCGSTIGVVAPASAAAPDLVDKGCAVLRDLGYKVVRGRHVTDDHRGFAGTDACRAADLCEMLVRPDVDAIVCVRGGTGSLRTLLAARAQLAASPPPRPKVFVGFSDTIYLHALLSSHLGWMTFHGPMFHHLVAGSPYTLDAFGRALGGAAAPFDVSPPPNLAPRTVVPGVAEGVLVGGWLAGLVDLLGTPWAFDLRGKILFFEDVRRAPSDVDRLLTVLAASGELAEVAGVVVGEHVQCGSGGYADLEPILREWLVPLGVPVLAQLPLGHGEHLATLPLGVRARLDATSRRLTILDQGVD